jgi:glycine amidinotransferase
MTPRDNMVMVGEKFYKNFYSADYLFADSYNKIKDQSWPACSTWAEFAQLPIDIQYECIVIYGLIPFESGYEDIFDHIQTQGNLITTGLDIQGAMLSRIGKDLYFGTENSNSDPNLIMQMARQEFPSYRHHVINTGGHSDATYCPVCPGLIISLYDVPTYSETFPDWEVVYLPGQSWDQVQPFLDLKKKNAGRWWIPGFEYDSAVTDVIETWLGHWTGYVEETVFDVNMLIVDPKNVIVFNYNKQVFDALDRYGITAHVVPFRHRYFWDGGVHCVTSDLHREGTLQDYFPERN